MNKALRIITVFIIMAFLISCEKHHEDLDLSMYQYRDTINLVRFVYKAKLLLEKKGPEAIEHFRNNRDIYRTSDYYIYIYDMEGNCLFNAGVNDLEGKNIIEYTDRKGKKVLKMILKALEEEDNPHSWVHFSWFELGKIYPVPKSTCNFRVKDKEGKDYFIGGGMNHPPEEKEFARIIVDCAARLLEEKGREALDEIGDSKSIFNYRDVYVFVLLSTGETLISPIVDETILDIHLFDTVDEVGHKPFLNAVEDLEDKDSTWQVFMTKSRYQRTLSKKALYLRKADMDGQLVYVGSITDMPSPP